MSREQVLNVAKLILTQCDCCMSKDKQGYNKFDCLVVRKLIALGDDIADQEVEYLRQKLLHYLKQFKDIGTQFEIPDKKIEEVIKELEKSICESGYICNFQTKNNKWHFGINEYNRLTNTVSSSEKKEAI